MSENTMETKWIIENKDKEIKQLKQYLHAAHQLIDYLNFELKEAGEESRDLYRGYGDVLYEKTQEIESLKKTINKEKNNEQC